MDVLSEQGAPKAGWRPMRLLERFRANVSALSSWESGAGVHAEVREPDIQRFGCDVSVLCEDATPAEALLSRELERPRTSPQRTALRRVFDRMRAIYARGGMASSFEIQRMLLEALHGQRSAVEAGMLESLSGRINDAFCREQAVDWLIERDLKVHLYGAGWGRNPRYARHVREFGGTAPERAAIAQFSKINLRLSGAGARDGWLQQGIGVGGFFLLRFCPMDVFGRIARVLWQYCTQRGLVSDEQLRHSTDPVVRKLIGFAGRTLGGDVFELFPSFSGALGRLASERFAECLGVVVPEYDRIAFSSRDELFELISRYLYDEPERRRIAGVMRQALIAPAGASEPAVGAEARRPGSSAGEVAA